MKSADPRKSRVVAQSTHGIFALLHQESDNDIRTHHFLSLCHIVLTASVSKKKIQYFQINKYLAYAKININIF